MKFKINDEVVEIASGKRCIVVATKKEGWNKKVDPFNRKQVFPNNNTD